MKSDREWYRRPMRICALQTAERSPGIGALKVWKRNSFNVEQLLHLIGEGYFAAFEERHAGAVKSYVAEAHRKGIRIILYLNTHLLPPGKLEKHEEWGARTPDGKLKTGYGTFTMGCVNTQWGDWIIESARRACACGVDGIFSDGPIGGCHCEVCRTRFAEGGAAWGTDYGKFQTRSLVEFVKRLAAAVKSANPKAVFYQNLAIHGAEAKEYIPYNDFVGSEGGFMFYGPPKWGYLWKPSLTAKMLDAMAGDKPTVIFAAADQKMWSLYPHAPAETKLMFASSVANGANVWYGMHFPLDLFKGPSARAAREINVFLSRHERWYEDTKSAANVALMYSSLSAGLYTSSKGASDFYGTRGTAKVKGMGNIGQAFEGMAAMLYQSQIPFDVVMDDVSEEDMKRYKCVLLPATPCMDAKLAERLRQYVAAGGNLISCLDVSMFDQEGKLRGDFALGDVLGIRFEHDTYSFHGFDYFSIEERHGCFKGIAAKLAQAPLHGLKIHANGAKVLARYHAPMSGCYVPLTKKVTPAIVWNSFGKGRSLYFAGDFGEFYSEYGAKEHRTIVRNAVALLARQSVQIEGAPESVEVTHRRTRDGAFDLIHLVNYTGGMCRPISEVVRLEGLELVVRGMGRVREITALSAGKKLRVVNDGRQQCRVAVPPLREYEVMVIGR